jgi:hypothetical protein
MKTRLLLCCFMLARIANAQEEAYFISSIHKRPLASWERHPN